MTINRSTLKPEVQAYLDRIDFDGPIDTSVACLAGLQNAHLHAVPYENLDILNRVPLSLAIPDLYSKIVERRRGGFCFELNSLFGWLLRELGFEVTDLFARFWRDEPNPPPKRRHQVFRVDIDGIAYLCDVGVGGIVPREPVRLVEGEEQRQGNETYRMDVDPYFGWVLMELKKGDWVRIYSFTEEPQLSKDFYTASFWCEYAPDSIFRTNTMVAIRTKEGRNTIAGREFRIFTSEGVKAFTPETEEDYRVALRTYFGIVLD
ncbi:arylamine N-acetyltransferase family protein [Paenibacillus koleovorans]|uniref:arylamine N-acetyltransferase family protein n=1 Tax=Paenibacillus koleovorans TaxID=121608 RepID=UPI000FDA7AB0|nr:arylamine N-acetyltransferase [Paenibacillus koleovorans]